MSCFAPIFCERLRDEIAAQPTRAPIWVPLMTTTLLREELYLDDRLRCVVAPHLGDDFVLDTLRVIHGPQERPAHRPLFPLHPQLGAAFGVRVALDLQSADHTTRSADVREPLALGAGLWLEWLFTRRWFVDTESDPTLPALRARTEDIAAIPDELGVLERLRVQATYERKLGDARR